MTYGFLVLRTDRFISLLDLKHRIAAIVMSRHCLTLTLWLEREGTLPFSTSRAPLDDFCSAKRLLQGVRIASAIPRRYFCVVYGSLDFKKLIMTLIQVNMLIGKAETDSIAFSSKALICKQDASSIYWSDSESLLQPMAQDQGVNEKKRTKAT